MSAPQYDSWESYFYADTMDWRGQGTLRNKLDERDADVLRAFEYAATQLRQRQILDGAVGIGRTFDADHVRAIHLHLFQDVYEWAGEYRTVNISKGDAPGGFADANSGMIDRYLADMHVMATSTSWSRLDRAGFVDACSRVFAFLNQAHPFREGNGRTAKVFMEHLADGSRFRFEFERVTPELWNQASMFSGPDLGAYDPHPEELRDVFDAIAVDR
ncbi:Fic family protein [Humibacter antri]